MKWEIENGGTLGNGGEFTPTQYPRSNKERDVAYGLNKGGTSQNSSPLDAVKINTDGNTSVPRHTDDPIDYYDEGDGSPVEDSVDDGAGRDEQG